MAFDYKKEFKNLYNPPKKPVIVDVPPMRFISVSGEGDPNDPSGEYANAIELLYGVAYTIKMSKRGDHRIDGYFDFVVPPLEGFWWQPGVQGVDYQHKENFHFVSLIRMPDFVTGADLDWAKAAATAKKGRDFGKVELLEYSEGLCVQCMHVGPYDDEPQTVDAMHEFAASEGYSVDITDERPHHEIYISDPRKTSAEKLKTIIRHPVKKA